MKVLKTISMLLAAALITLGANAQTAAAPAKQDSKAAAAKSDAKQTATPAATPAKSDDKKPGDARTKTGDKINKDLKGPNGETVYTGPKGGDYYLAKDGSKKYLPKKK